MRQARQTACRAQPLEFIDQLVAFLHRHTTTGDNCP
jgi:hypothetical protein